MTLIDILYIITMFILYALSCEITIQWLGLYVLFYHVSEYADLERNIMVLLVSTMCQSAVYVIP